MNLSGEGKRLLAELCGQNGVSKDKVLKLLETVYEYEFKDRLDRIKLLHVTNDRFIPPDDFDLAKPAPLNRGDRF